MAWIWLLASGLVEIVWCVSLKYANGFRCLWPTVVVIVSGVVSMALLSLALRGISGISMGTAYAVWAGIGAVGVAVTGMFLFGESRELLRLLSIAVVIAGIVGLKLTGS